ncbi:MAG: DNA-binding protein, partial [Evtepia sp.]
LYVEPSGVTVNAERIGGTSDIAAGQLIDRTGKRLGLSFPAGKAVDALAQTAEEESGFMVKVKEMEFSLSGIENQMNQRVESGVMPASVCRFVLASVIFAVEQATKNALRKFPGLPVLCAGGVSSNALLRDVMTKNCNALFAPAEFSTDNAMGVAIITWRMLAAVSATN